MDFENQSVTSPWATRRKMIILGAIVLVLSAISFGIFWKFWYVTPTCFDGRQNGDETGVDCGGSCTLVCNSSVIKPIVKWDPRLFEVSPGLWSALVYVENPNTNADATYVPYSFTIYDENNNVLIKKDGATILPKNKTVGIFEGPLTFKEGVNPKKAIFDLGDGIVWNKDEASAPDITVSNGPLLQLLSQPRIEADVKNNSIQEIKNIELVVAIFDGSDNAIAASRTFIETLKKDEDANIFFTWPKPFKLGSKVCEKPADVMLLLDRSGSMAALGTNPPEPLTSVKTSASDFVSLLSKNDSVGLISFATDVTADSGLSNDFNAIQKSINNMQINSQNTQYTNIADALSSAISTLFISPNSDNSNRQRVIVLLTDGVANRPQNPNGSKSDSEEVAYAENLALKTAAEAKQDDIIIYTIGLGKNIHADFLKQVASSTDDFFQAPTASDLKTIYKNISSDICKEMPARIEITYKIFGTLN